MPSGHVDPAKPEAAAKAVTDAVEALNRSITLAAAQGLIVVVRVYDLQQMGQPSTQLVGVRILSELGHA